MRRPQSSSALTLMQPAADVARPAEVIPMHLSEVVFGWEAIAKVLGRSPDTAQRLAERSEDPLPVFWEIDKYGAFVQAILAFRARNRHSLKTQRELIRLRSEVRRLRRRSNANAGS